ncbi:hypothetical protein CJF31_00003586 [Rutstroemia sp. NJR-2017a BVV2]|nr:hypothetical protein CJF31_00003586 [Rutstroemia sp. NJR-2017a BVV2]
MRPLSFSRCLLPLVACSIGAINAQSVQTVYSQVTRFKISVVPEYTTITETTYSIITATGPQVIHTDYITVTQDIYEPTTIAGGVSTVTVTEPANQVTIVQTAGGDVTISECTATVTEPSSECPTGGAVITETVTDSGVTETVTNAGATETVTEGGCSSSLSSQVPSTTEAPITSTTYSTESSAEASSGIPPINNAVSGETMSTELTSSSEFPTEIQGASTTAESSTSDVFLVSSTEVPVTSTQEPIATSTGEVVISSGGIATSTEFPSTSSTAEPEVSLTVVLGTSTALVEEPTTSAEIPITSTEESLPSSTGIPPINNAVSGQSTSTTEEPLVSTTEIPVESTTLIGEPATSTELPAATSTLVGEPATSTQGPTEPSTTAEEPATSTQAPASESTSIEEPPVTTEVVSEPSTSIGEPPATTEIVPSSTEERISSTTEAAGESTTLVEGPPTSTLLSSSTEEVIPSTTELPTESTGIPPVNNAVSGTTLSTTDIAPEVTSSTPELPPSTILVAPPTSTNSYNFNCPTIPALFSVVVEQEGKPIQYLTQLNYPDHGTSESLWGYDTLPIVSSEFQAAHFSIGGGGTFMATHDTGTLSVPITAAVRISNLGNTPVQLYSEEHIGLDMRTYAATVDGQCRLGLDVPPSGANILASCGGILNVLTPAKKLARGSSCVTVNLYAVEVSAPLSSSALAPTETPTTAMSTQVPSAVTASAPLSSFTTVTGCTVAPYFKILIHEAGMAAQYLYDPVALGDDALSFTSNPDMSLIFYLNPNDQLTFNIIDFFGNPMVLASNQDQHNAGNEAVFFTTATKFSQLGYEPVVATVNGDCSIGLTLPYNAASVIMECEGTLWLRLAPSDACRPITLLMLPYNPSGTDTTALPSATPFLV